MKNSKRYISRNIYLKNTRAANLMALRPDLSIEVHFEQKWFQIVLSDCLSTLQVMKFWKGIKAGANSRQSADWPHSITKGRYLDFPILIRSQLNNMKRRNRLRLNRNSVRIDIFKTLNVTWQSLMNKTTVSLCFSVSKLFQLYLKILEWRNVKQEMKQ